MIDLNSDTVGSDCQGSVYKNIEEMWEAELNREKNVVNGISPDLEARIVNPIGSVDNWYAKQAEYWEKTEASVDGVLGGFGKLNAPDAVDSKKFLVMLKEKFNLPSGRAIDCGAGVGRVTKEVLLNHFAKIDVTDQDKRYVEVCKENFKAEPRVERYIASGIQDLVLEDKYDCIWIQWVSNYITDKDYLRFLAHCKEHINPNGLIIVKENIAKVGFIVDKEDNSVTRSDKLFCDLFEKAGLEVVETQMQSNFPKDLFKVKSYALKFKTL